MTKHTPGPWVPVRSATCDCCKKKRTLIWSVCRECIDAELAEEHQIKTELGKANEEIKRLKTALVDAEINIMRAIRNAKNYGSTPQ